MIKRNPHHGKFALAALAALCVILITGPMSAQIKLHPGLIPGKVIHNANVRDFAYCEIAPVLGTPPKLVTVFYNTSGPDDYCPVDKMGALDPKKLATELGAKSVYLNPTPRSARRRWVMDQLWFFAVGKSVDFHGVKGTWGASTSLESMKALLTGPYTPGTIHRQTKYLYAKGSRVFLLRGPGGKTWVIESYATEIDPNLTFDQLPQLDSKLNLPEGYKFEVKTLTQDLTIDLRKAPDNTAHIVRDELHDVYEGCGFDHACNYTP